jgi:hypothetical protein
LFKTTKPVEEHKLLSFMADITSGGMTKDGHIVLKTAKKKYIRHGLTTVAKHLGLECNDVSVITNYKRLPDEFIRAYTKLEFDPKNWPYRFGKMRCNDYMKTICKMKVLP